MKLLLDTNIFIWWTEDSPKLSPTIRSAIADPASELYLSTASVWEIVIKQQLGKLNFPAPLEQTIPYSMAQYGLFAFLSNSPTSSNSSSCRPIIEIPSIA